MKTIEYIIIYALFLSLLLAGFMKFSHPAVQPQSEPETKKNRAINVQQLYAKIPKSLSERKKQYLKTVLPAVYKVDMQLRQKYDRAKEAIANNDEDTLKKLKNRYGADTNKELLAAIKPHPKSITLAQAAVESAWATSRFYKRANNLFGVWSFNKNEPRIQATGSREGQKVWLRKYDSAKESIADYYETIATGYAYEEFREFRLKTDDPFTLIDHLGSYSEKGTEYTALLKDMIKHNDFTRFDR
ncbi:MAG: glucosaminidase domain-containing protein [Campylobacterota bacterium]